MLAPHERPHDVPKGGGRKGERTGVECELDTKYPFKQILQGNYSLQNDVYSDDKNILEGERVQIKG